MGLVFLECPAVDRLCNVKVDQSFYVIFAVTRLCSQHSPSEVLPEQPVVK